jgi:hypothetical protein
VQLGAFWEGSGWQHCWVAPMPAPNGSGSGNEGSGRSPRRRPVRMGSRTATRPTSIVVGPAPVAPLTNGATAGTTASARCASKPFARHAPSEEPSAEKTSTGVAAAGERSTNPTSATGTRLPWRPVSRVARSARQKRIASMNSPRSPAASRAGPPSHAPIGFSVAGGRCTPRTKDAAGRSIHGPRSPASGAWSVKTQTARRSRAAEPGDHGFLAGTRWDGRHPLPDAESEAGRHSSESASAS